MGLIREPKNIDFSVKSKPWTKKELADFRKLMKEIKDKNAKLESLKKLRGSSKDKSARRLLKARKLQRSKG